MKKILSVLMTLILTISMIIGCNAEESNPDAFSLTMQIGNPVMTVNGAEKPIDNEETVPVIINNTTLLPVRAVVEEMGGTVNWDGRTQSITLNYGEDEIRLAIDNLTAYLNNTVQTLDTAPTIINERTMLPIRFIAESFKFKVDWTQGTQTVTITKATETPTEAPTEALTETISVPTTLPSSGTKALVVYYSALGNTRETAGYIASAAKADVFELEPAEPYEDDDLDWTDEDSRVVHEHDNENERDVALVSATISDWDSYDVVFIGYPIWWGIAAWPVNSFIKANDFTGKIVIPFCTSASSGLGDSGKLLENMAGTGDWQTGIRFSSGAAESDVTEWTESIIESISNKAD